MSGVYVVESKTQEKNNHTKDNSHKNELESRIIYDYSAPNKNNKSINIDTICNIKMFGKHTAYDKNNWEIKKTIDKGFQSIYGSNIIDCKLNKIKY